MILTLARIGETTPSRFAETSDMQTWRETSCPVELLTYSCYYQNMTERASKLSRMFHPENFNSTEIMNSLRNKTVLFLGDSIMMQQWQVFVCFLHGETPALYDEVNWYYASFLPAKNCPWGQEHCFVQTGCVYYKG